MQAIISLMSGKFSTNPTCKREIVFVLEWPGMVYTALHSECLTVLKFMYQFQSVCPSESIEQFEAAFNFKLGKVKVLHTFKSLNFFAPPDGSQLQSYSLLQCSVIALMAKDSTHVCY